MEPLKLHFIALGTLNDIHTYAWLNNYRKKLGIGDNAYFITVSDHFIAPNTLYNGLFKKINEPVVVSLFRNGKLIRYMYVYLLKSYTGLML